MRMVTRRQSLIALFIVSALAIVTIALLPSLGTGANSQTEGSLGLTTFTNAVRSHFLICGHGSGTNGVALRSSLGDPLTMTPKYQASEGTDLLKVRNKPINELRACNNRYGYKTGL